MNTSTASTGCGSSCSSCSGSAFGSSSGSGTGYNTGSKIGTGSGSSSIGPSIYGDVIVPTTTIEEKEKHNQQLQEQLRESNKARFAIIVGWKQPGKNAMQKMKNYALDSQDKCNIDRISHIIHQIIWLCNKILLQKWTTFQEHPQSMC